MLKRLYVRIRIGCVIGGGLIWLGVSTGCSPSVSPPALLLNIDGSMSTDAVRGKQMGVLDTLVQRMPVGSRFIVHRFDFRVSRIAGEHPNEPRDLWPVQDKDLKPSAGRKGTRPDLMLKHITEQVIPVLQEQQIGVVLVWDGGNNGKSLKPYITQLAQNKRIRIVWLVGLKRELWPQVEPEFKALASSGRLMTSGLDDAPQDVARFRERLQRDDT